MGKNCQSPGFDFLSETDIIISLWKVRLVAYGARLESTFPASEHDGGKVESTRNRRPLILVCYEAYPTKQEAQGREKYLKSSDGRKELRIRLKVTLQKYL